MRKGAIRRAYYQSLGLTPGYLDELYDGILSENIKEIDLNRLRKSVTKFGLTQERRGLAWKLILGVLPPQTELWNEVRMTFFKIKYLNLI